MGPLFLIDPGKTCAIWFHNEVAYPIRHTGGRPIRLDIMLLPRRCSLPHSVQTDLSLIQPVFGGHVSLEKSAGHHLKSGCLKWIKGGAFNSSHLPPPVCG